MKKSTGIITLLLSLVAIVGLGYIAMFGINASKMGAASNIKQGLDLAGGVSITYQVVGDEEPSTEDMNDTIYKLQKRVENYSTEAQVYKEGTDRINIEIPGISDANAVLEELGQPGTLYFISQTGSDGSENYGITILDDGSYDYALLKSIDDLKADCCIVLDGTMVASAQSGASQNEQGATTG